MPVALHSVASLCSNTRDQKGEPATEPVERERDAQPKAVREDLVTTAAGAGVRRARASRGGGAAAHRSTPTQFCARKCAGLD
jgi:hypothetical protein